MSTSTAGLTAFLFTDIEGSSLRWLHHRAAMEQAVARHDGVTRRVVMEHDGEIFKTSGDAFYAAFARPADAVNAAVAVQRGLLAEDFSAVGGMKTRMAVHVGSAERRGGDYFGPALNRTARLMDLAHGGQILATSSLPELLAAERDVHATFDRVGIQPLDDPAQPVGVYQVVAHGLPEQFPPLRTAKTRLPDAPAVGSDSIVALRKRSPVLLVLLAILAIALAGLVVLRSKMGRSPIGPSATVPEKSIAVLPFENLSEEKQNEFFANGIQDEILTDLARIADLKVISRSSVMQYKSGATRNLREIAPALGVVYILEGSVQRAGGKVRVTAQLIDSRTDAHVWADRYDRDLADVFAIQSEIAEKIAGQLKVRLSDSEKAALAEVPTRDLQAYDLYLQAQQLNDATFTLGQLKTEDKSSVRLLTEAVNRDPNFFLAWCALAFAQDWEYRSGLDMTPARLALAQAAVDAAVRLKPDAGETHLALAYHAYFGERDFTRAQEQLALAQRSLPNNSEIFRLTGLIDRRQGRWEESNRNLERALDLDPRNNILLTELGAESYFPQRRFADAERILRRFEALRPGAPEPQLMLRVIEFLRDANLVPSQRLIDSLQDGPDRTSVVVAKAALAVALLRRDPEVAERALLLLSPDSTKPIYWDDDWHPRSYFVGRIAQLRNDTAAAQKAFGAARQEAASMAAEQPNNSGALLVLAIIDSQLGRNEDALRGARMAYEMEPIEKDALSGPGFLLVLAEIEGRAGEKDRAFEHLARLADIPSPLYYGVLCLASEWDPLRSDPRFQALVEKLAPKGPKP